MLVDNIDRLCKERGISICALEKAADVANGTIWKWRNRGQSARIETVKKIADCLGCTVDDLLRPDTQDSA